MLQGYAHDRCRYHNRAAQIPVDGLAHEARIICIYRPVLTVGVIALLDHLAVSTRSDRSSLKQPIESS